MKFVSLSASILFLGLASSAAGASPYELVMTASKSSAGSGGLAFDVISDGTATGLEIRVDMGLAEGAKAKVDTSGCAKSLPSSHAGSCVFNGKEVVILVYSNNNDLLPTGSIDLGTVYFSGSASGLAKGPAVTSFIAGSPDGKPVGSSIFSEK